MKDANRSTRLKPGTKRQRTAPVPQTKKAPGDARDNEQQLHENQDQLGVDSNHMTPEMEEKKRGTFP